MDAVSQEFLLNINKISVKQIVYFKMCTLQQNCSPPRSLHATENKAIMSSTMEPVLESNSHYYCKCHPLKSTQ